MKNTNEKNKIRDIRKKYFQVDDVYIDGYAKHCGIYATGVYISLCRHANKEQSCWPSHDKVAEELNISRSQVKRSLKILEKYNIIKKIRIGKRQNNIYLLLDKSNWKESDGSIRAITSKSDGSIRPQVMALIEPSIYKVTHKKDIHISLPTLSHFENLKGDYTNEEGGRERIIKKLKNYFPSILIPKNIVTQKLDYFLFLIEEEEVNPEKIWNPVAYIRGLTVVESFLPLVEREKRKAEIEKRKIEEKEKKEKERAEVDFDFNLSQLKEIREQLGLH